MKEIVTGRLFLRRIVPEDTQRIFDCWTSDPAVSKFVGWNTHQSIHDTKDFMSFIVEQYEKPDCYRWGITLRDTGELIGMIDVVGFHKGCPVIGYCSGRAYWGNGYMTEALKAVTVQLFSDGFDTLVIEAVDENIGSNRVIEKAGFEKVAERVAPVSDMKKDQLFKINSYRLYRSR